MNNRIEILPKEVQRVLDVVKTKTNKQIIILPRDIETGKNPREFMVEVGIDYGEAYNIIRSLSIEDYKECILDQVHNYICLYVFKRYINDISSYIKIGFLHDIKSGDVHVVSFHRDMMLMEEKNYEDNKEEGNSRSKRN